MSELTFDKVAAAAAKIRSCTTLQPTTGVILGSGLGAFADRIENATRIPYGDIPHYSPSHVIGHKGELVLGMLQGTPIAVMNGRTHAYEGHELAQTTLPVRVLKALGVQRLMITNAAGGVNPTFTPGDFMVIGDHINLTGLNPLRGPHDERLGVRFPDMTHVYSLAGRTAWHTAARSIHLHLREGVYVGLMGPSYETPAEIRMLQRLGGDAVGMSTVAEAIVARHAGLEVAGLSVVSNHAAGLSPTPLSHEEVTAVATKVRGVLCELLAAMVQTWK